MARQGCMSQRRAPTVAALVAIVSSLGAGCTRGHDGGSDMRAVIPAVDTLSNGVPVSLAQASGEWVNMWRKAAPEFTPDSLTRRGRSSASLGLRVQPLDHSLVADTDSSVLREVLGEISPTGRYVLIADAYRALPDSEVENPAGGEADEAAVLIDYQRRTCDVFLVLGTPYTLDWGGWVDSTHFALAGSESDEENSCFGFVRLYSISENSVTMWNTRRLREAYPGPVSGVEGLAAPSLTLPEPRGPGRGWCLADAGPRRPALQSSASRVRARSRTPSAMNARMPTMPVTPPMAGETPVASMGSTPRPWVLTLA